MTDSFSPHTQTAPSATNSASKATISPNQATLEPDEVEDYTIKCICGYEEDDGNTVYCDRCDTWQHTECYYIDEHGAVPTNDDLKKYDHYCADCQPRLLDRKGAIERQKNRRNEVDLGDRKIKKIAPKSHKKKIRVPDSNGALPNGWAHGFDIECYDRTSRGPKDLHPPAKKPKTNHRFSNSMQFSVLTPNPTSHPHKRSGSIINSPSKAHRKYSPNGFANEPYSVEFLHLYDNDPGDALMQTNLLSDIDITRDLGNWSKDLDELEKATNGFPPREVFHRCEQPVSSMTLPQLTKECREDEIALIHGQHPKWKYLTIDSFTPKDSVVAELKGKIGHMQRYIQDPINRWDYLRHPVPFVFFHPKLPIYIDTRSEGTVCRYLRRSCDPNLSMKTFLENGSDYHFCFVAKHDLDAGSELTIGWVLDGHIRNYLSSRNHENVKLEGDLDEDYVADWVGKVLAEFGGCACTSPARCALARYDRRIPGAVKGQNKYLGKQPSPESRYLQNSSTGSEQEDRQSSSGSKSQSRDVTPNNNTSGDSAFGAGIEISDREKRKIAALEKNFEQLVNDKHQPAQKKKKRNSGGSNVNTPSTSTSVSTSTGVLKLSAAKYRAQKQLGHAAASYSQPNTPGLISKLQYIDTGTSHRKSGSPINKSYNSVERPRSNTTTDAKKRTSQPNTPFVPSPLFRQNYVSTSMQTEPDEEDAWYEPPITSIRLRKPYMSLTKRLLLRSQKDRAKLEERREVSYTNSESIKFNAYTVSDGGNPQICQGSVDVEMRDSRPIRPENATSAITGAESGISCAPTDQKTVTEIKPPPPWTEIEQSRPTNGHHPSDLRVQLPPKASLSSDGTPSTLFMETPTSALPPSPFLSNTAAHPPSFLHSSSTLVQPSSIKKKVSLGEYISRRKGSQPATELQSSSSPHMHQGALNPLPLVNGDSRNFEMQGSAVADTPNKEESDPLAAASKESSP